MNLPLATPAGAPIQSHLPTEAERRRTFAIISHPDAGKTTLTEKLLLFGGAIQLAGQVKAKRDRRSTRSDWMAIERERGISVVTSVMTFEYDGRVFNLLDTPGHEDFSEDTYRTLTAVDSAVMVIDAAKGIEPRTRKLFEVCRLRDIPIITFINKMDRESRDPFDLLDEIEKTLALDTAPVNWPVGRGRDFVGTIDVASGGVRLLDGDAGAAGRLREMTIAEVAALNPNIDAAAFGAEFELVHQACRRFDPVAFGEGHLTPVFFGSALKNFGVGDLLNALGALAPPPRSQQADKRVVTPAEPGMSAFVFKVQANMDPKHRDRIAFARLCSGKLTRGMKVKQVRTGKNISLQAPQFFFAQDRVTGRGGLCGRRGRHPQSRHAADRRHADGRRGLQLRRRAELRARDPAPGAAARRHEGEEAQAGAAGAGRGGRRAGVPAGRRLARHGRRGRPAAARGAESAARCRIRADHRVGHRRVPVRALDLVRRPQGARPVHHRASLVDRRGPRRRSGVHGAQRLRPRLHRQAECRDRASRT